MHFPDTLDDEAHFKQLTAEYQDDRGRWQLKHGRRNEGLDIHVYAMSALQSLDPDWDELERNIGIDNYAYKVFTSYNPAKHYAPDYEIAIDKPIIICVTFSTDVCVWVLAQTDGMNVKVFDEIVLRGADTTRMGRELRKRYAAQFREGQEFIIYGPEADRSEYALLSELGLRRQRIDRKSDIKARMNAIANMLEDKDGKARLTFHPRCGMLRKDFEMCAWREDGMDIDSANGRGYAVNALGHFINCEWPLRSARPNPSRRFYK
jgi:hypothetical protein